MNKQEINKWSDKVRTDENLKALSDIRVLMENYEDKGYSYGWEQSELIDEIEEICESVKNKKISIQSIIKAIKEYYESVGRGEAKQEFLILPLIHSIVWAVRIPPNYLVISRLKNNDNRI